MKDKIKNKKVNRRKKGIIVKLFCWLLLFVVIFVLAVIAINIYIVNKEKGKIVTVEEASKLDADCIIVLGAGVRNDGSPTWMLEDRIIIGDKLYKEKAAPKIIMSGDHGKADYDEVNVMKNYAMNEGVPSTDIFMDHAGFETYDSMYRAKEIFGAKKVIIVTQKYHMYRALYIADKLGLDAYGVTSDLRYYSKKMAYWKFREYLARIKSFGKCIYKPEPKYLGDSIDLKANGDVTNDRK